MSTICFFNGYIYDHKIPSFVKGSVLCENGSIIDILFGEKACFSADTVVDLHGKYLTPGFTDAHTHGRAGYDFNTANTDAIEIMLKSYAKSGVTSLFPTLASAPFDSLLEQGKRIREFTSSEKTAHAVGVHVEGRYLNPQKKGAHNPELLSPPNADEVAALLQSISLPMHVSAAYELDQDESFIKALRSAGATAGLAHTSADYAKALDLYNKYGISLSHMFNAMPPLHHREGGAVCAGLCSDMYTEIICDGIHVSAEMVKLAYKCKGSERLVLVSDSMEATDCPDGEYSIAGLPVVVKDSIARTLDGALAGSTLSLETAVNNLVSFTDTDIPSALRCATVNPCRMLGIFDRYGSIEKGKSADLIIADITDKKFKVVDVYVSAGA